MTKLRCAILDDYQNVALPITDWSPINNQVEIQSFHQYFHNEGELVAAIRDFHIVIIMRERTPFPASLFALLPQLQLLIRACWKSN